MINKHLNNPPFKSIILNQPRQSQYYTRKFYLNIQQHFLPTFFHILSHQIAPDSTLIVSNSTGQQGTSNRTLKICLFTVFIVKNDNNATTVGKAVNALMKLIHVIEVYANKVKIAQWKRKKTNLEVMKYTKDRKYPEAEVGKYVFAVREGQSREGRNYVRIQLSISHDVTWNDWYTILRGRRRNKEV